jgi:hypothetical protein
MSRGLRDGESGAEEQPHRAERLGNHIAIACHMANESYFRKPPVYWDAANRRITA